jgi:hypothetical protein
VETSCKRQAVRVEVGRCGGLKHQRPDHEMG